MVLGLANTLPHRQRPGVQGAGGAVEPAQFVFSGVASEYLEAPNGPEFAIPGAIEIVMRVRNPAWETAPAVSQWWLGNGAFSLARSSTGGTYVVQFTDTPGGVLHDLRITPTAVIPNDATIWMRWRLQPNDGAGGAFFSLDYAADSATEPAVWTPFGVTDTEVGPSTIKTPTAGLRFGGISAVVPGLAGRIRRLIVRDGFDGETVLDASEGSADTGASTFICATGQTITETGDIIQPIPDAQFVFPGVAGNRLAVPDGPELDIEGDLEITARVDMGALWGDASRKTVLNKWQGGTLDRAYMLDVVNDRLELTVSSTGANSFAFNSALLSTAGLTSGRAWIRGTRIASTGAVAFALAPDQAAEPSPGAWQALAPGGGTTFAGPIAADTSPVWLGEFVTAGREWAGSVHRVIVRDDGTTVLDISEADCHDPDDHSFMCSTGQVVTETGDVIVPAP